MTVAHALAGRLFFDFERNPAARFRKMFDPRAHHHPVTPSQGPLILNRGGRHKPTQPQSRKGLHRHPITALHLVKPRRQDVIEVASAVNVLIKIDIVRPDGEFGFKFSVHVH